MTTKVRAVYKDGQLHLMEPVNLPDGQEIEIIITSLQEAEQVKQPRKPGLHRNSIWISDDFDDPLPDEFWLGGE